MTEASRWRLEIARKVVPLYAEHPDVQVVVVGGSVSYGVADRYSDVEIGIFWSRKPSMETRKSLAKRMGIGEDFEPWNKHGHDGADESVYIWGDRETGFQLDIKHRTSHAEAQDLNHPEGGSWEFWKYAIPLYGHTLAQQWREKTVPPTPELARLSIRKHLENLPPWWLVEQFANEGEYALFTNQCCGILSGLGSSLCTLNRSPHYLFKYPEWTIEQMKIKPADFWYRFENAFFQPLENAAQDLRRLIEETLDLIDHHMPEIDTTTARKSVFGHQPRWVVRSTIDLEQLQGWQQKLLDELVRPYATHSRVKTIALSGAASRRKIKTYADLELTVYWTHLPSERVRRNIITHTGATHQTTDGTVDTVEHSDIRIDIHHVAIEDTKRLIAEVIERYDPDLSKLNEIAVLQHSIPLYGENILHDDQQQTTRYPKELIRCVVLQTLSEFRWSWSNRIDIYAPRKALPFFFFLLGYQSSRMCRIIMALNGIYPSGGAAPFLPTLSKLSIAPPNFIHRQTFQFSLEERVRRHHDLMTHMFDLIETHLPDINVESEREGFEKERRKPWDHPQEINW